MHYKIAIDGPAGTGKSTVSKIISENYDLLFLNSGIFYRACALIINNKNLDNIDEIKNELENNKITFKNGSIYINDKLFKNELFTNEISTLSSKYSSIKIVRDHVNEMLRKISKDEKVIMDGRDVGTIIFPDAELKFFLTAGIIERAKRRKKNLSEIGKEYSLLFLMKEIFFRDWRDKHRKNDPLKKANNAILINTNNKTIDDVVGKISNEINEFLKCRK